MTRKAITRCPKTGRTIEVWVDKGPGRAVPFHGRRANTQMLATGMHGPIRVPGVSS